MTAATIKTLLVDDERPARRWLARLLRAHADVEIAGEAGTVEEAARVAAGVQPDVVFLDVQMPPANGFELLPHLPPGARVVFVTAHDAYAVRAFQTNALDYLLKPVHPERLEETLRRLRLQQPAPAVSADPPQSLGLDDITPLRDGRLLRMVRVGDIAAIEAEGAYTRVRICGQPPVVMLRRVREWEDVLPDPPFFRVERSLIVNLRRIHLAEGAVRDETRLVLHDAGELILGRAASRRLWRLL
ncbi:MAG: hypothetical protein BGO12_05850 [Verrucomicrobia bacterium 61-8]|nr:response regulator transcription factor [Verrucomicrobiota bacterium]OJV02166.1 MAG: hypothetical protein BGO12_05850 [Verrucomicrobia bacterium 61-8]